MTASTRSKTHNAAEDIEPASRGWDRIRARGSNPKQSSTQVAAGVATSIFACLGTACGVYWITQYRGTPALFGSSESRFLLHPVAMLSGMLFFLTHGCLVWRMPELLVSRGVRQLLHHAGANDVGTILVALGFWATYSTHEKPHIHSLHSWMGVATLILLVSQVCAGLTFILPRSLAMRLVPVGFHKRMGILTLITGLTTILTGLMDFVVMLVKDKRVGKESNEMWLINTTGIFVLLTMLSFLYTILPQEKSGAQIEKAGKQELAYAKTQ